MKEMTNVYSQRTESKCLQIEIGDGEVHKL